MELKNLATNGIVMIAAQAVRMWASYVLLYILYLRLQPDAIALYSNFITMLAIATPFLTLKPEALVGWAYFHLDRAAFARYAGSTILTVLILSAVGIVLVPLIGGLARPLTGLPGSALLLIPIYTIGYGYNYVCSTVLQLVGYPTVFALLRSGEGVLRLVIGAALVLIVGVGWFAPLIAVTVATAVMGAVSYQAMRRLTGLRLPLCADHVRHYVTVGGASIPMTVAAALAQGADKLFLTAHLGLTATGVYAVGAIVASGLWIVANAFQQVWMPFLFTALKEGGSVAMARLRIAVAIFCVFMIVAGGALVLVGDYAALRWMDPRYESLTGYFAWLVLAYVLSGIRLLFDNVFLYFARTGLLSAIMCAGSALTVCLCAFLVPLYQERGAAAALLIANAITLLAAIVGAVLLLRPRRLRPEEARP